MFETIYIPLIWDIHGARFCDIYTSARVLWLQPLTDETDYNRLQVQRWIARHG